MTLKNIISKVNLDDFSADDLSQTEYTICEAIRHTRANKGLNKVLGYMLDKVQDENHSRFGSPCLDNGDLGLLKRVPPVNLSSLTQDEKSTVIEAIDRTLASTQLPGKVAGGLRAIRKAVNKAYEADGQADSFWQDTFAPDTDKVVGGRWCPTSQKTETFKYNEDGLLVERVTTTSEYWSYSDQ